LEVGGGLSSGGGRSCDGVVVVSREREGAERGRRESGDEVLTDRWARWEGAVCPRVRALCPGDPNVNHIWG
jgi:hypothetical protein